MIDIAKGVLDGGWALIVGWIFPSALSVLIFGLVVYPSVDGVPPFSALDGTAAIVTAAVLAGILLSALQTPLYRSLEGYTWPSWVYGRRQQRHVLLRLRLKHTLNLAGYGEAKAKLERTRLEVNDVGKGNDEARTRKAEQDFEDAKTSLATWERAGIEGKKWLVSRARNSCKAEKRTAKIEQMPRLRRQVLAERLARYPTEEDQILPSLLGNAIRRFERFGPEHYGLDQQRLWYELMGLAPEAISKQVGQMRTAVDFFVALFYGQLVITLSAIVMLILDAERRTPLAIGGAAGLIIGIMAYRGAVVATDEWAYSVQALVNVGRLPLAKALSLRLPKDLADEQDMWRRLGRMLMPKPSSETFSSLSEYRIQASAEEPPKKSDAPAM